ncbi:MAG: hypothetical protein M0Z80_06135, partial [Treponema sp.]|nr:hypothetical protein [Treponema sp.]
MLAALGFVVSCASAPPPQAQALQPQPAAPAPSSQAPDAAQARAQAIVQGGADLSQPARAPSSSGAPQAPAPAGTAAAAAPASPDQPGPLPNQLTPAEEAYLQNYLSHLNYMVYYDESSKIDPQI